MSSFGRFDIWSFEELDKEESKQKNRNWCAIVYPESAPDDWMDQLRDLHLPFAVSPLHDKDQNDDFDPKKAHYHIIVCFEGPTTYKNANRCIQRITNGPIVKVCHSVRGSYRYFTHMDDPHKFQYSSDEIKCFNDFEVAVTASDEDIIKKAIFYIILVNRIQEYAELMLVLEHDFGYEFAQVARRNHSYIASVVNSIRHAPGATYKRFFRYVTPEEWDHYALEDEYMYDNSYEWISKCIGKEEALQKKSYRKAGDPGEEV